MLESAMRRFLPLISLIVLGCSRGDDTAVDLSPCTISTAPSAMFELHQVEEEAGWELHASALVLDGPYPSWQQTLLESEHCRYGYYLPTSCEPECPDGSFCTGGECLGFPDGLDAGTLTVEGLGEPLQLEVSETRPGSYHTSVELGFDAFGEGSPVRFSATGAAFPAVELAARGVSLITTPATEDGLRWTHGDEVTIEWNAGADPDACVTLHLGTQAFGHGTPLANLLECIVPDTGSYTFPVELVDLFPEYDTPGLCVGNDCPWPEIRRVARQVVSTEGGDAWLSVWTGDRFPLEAGD